jgi:hypothetical protein
MLGNGERRQLCDSFREEMENDAMLFLDNWICVFSGIMEESDNRKLNEFVDKN